MAERESFHEVLKPSAREFWIGTDVALCKTALLPPRTSTTINVLVDPKNMYSLEREKLKRTSMTMRSRNAQVGADISGYGEQVGHYMEAHGITRETEPFQAEINIDNFSTRPLLLVEGQRLGRPFYEGENATITGNELEELFLNRDIHIIGEEGVEWKKRREPRRREFVGVFVQINPENRRWTQPDPQNTPIVLSDEDGLDFANRQNGFDYRRQVDTLLSPVPEMSIHALWIGETFPEIHLNGDVNAILHTAVVGTINGKKVLGSHLNSPVLDAGRTRWRARVEVVSRTTPDYMPHYVYVTFVRNGDKKSI